MATLAHFMRNKRSLMFSKDYSQGVQKPTELQKSAELIPFQLQPPVEITCAAFEPRFKLTGVGTSEGRLLVLNADRVMRISKKKLTMPLCSLFSCVNTSSFLSISSAGLSDRNPLHLAPREFAPAFNKYIFRKGESTLAHWIVDKSDIVVRVATVKFDVITAAISPSHPQFAILGMSDGSIMGFSIEEMKFTELYLNSFEGKGLTCLACPRGLEVFVCWQVIDRLKLKELESSTAAKMEVKAIDIAGESATVITPEGKLLILKKFKKHTEPPPIQDHLVVYAAMLTETTWVAIFRSAVGDVVVVNGEEKLRLENDFVVLNVLTDYDDIFARIGLRYARFITCKGQMIDISGNKIDLFAPSLKGCKALMPEFEISLWKKTDEDKCIMYRLKDCSFTGAWEFSGTVPFVGLQHQFFLAAKEKEILLYNVAERTTATMIPLATPVKRIEKSMTFVDILTEDGTIYSTEIMAPQLRFELLGIQLPQDVVSWRRVQKEDETTTFAFLTAQGDLLLEGTSTKAVDKKETLIGFEVLNQYGRVTDKGAFLLVITDSEVKLFEPFKLKKVKKRKLKEKPVDFSFTTWNSLILQFSSKIEILALPDVSESLGSLPIGKESEAILIDGGGLLMIDPDRTFIYMKQDELPPLFNDTPPIEEPPEVVKHFIGSSTRPKATLTETDETFKFKRAAGSLSETTDLMQQLLVVARERSEKLEEMQLKAERLADSARKYAETARRFRK